MAPQFFKILETADERAELFSAKGASGGGWRDTTIKLPSLTTVPALLKTKRSDALAEWAVKHSSDHAELFDSAITKEQAKVFLKELKIPPLSGDRSETLKRLCDARKTQVQAEQPELNHKELAEQRDIEEGKRRTAHPLFRREL